MKIKSAEFVISVATKEQLLKDGKVEIAFAGKSNVGKSSFINALCGQKKLAKTSSLPGRTRLINYFLINKEFYFVDLPGYGYAEAGKSNQIMWANLLEEYLLKSDCLSLVFMLVDIRHTPTDLDKTMIRFLYQRQIPFKIIATKSDKIAKTKIAQFVQNIASSLGVGAHDIIAFSSENMVGNERVLEEIQHCLNEFIIKQDEEKSLQYSIESMSKMIKGEKTLALLKELLEKNIEIDITNKFELSQLFEMGLVNISDNIADITDLGEKVAERIFD